MCLMSKMKHGSEDIRKNIVTPGVHKNTNLVAINIENMENVEFCKQVASGLRWMIISYKAKSFLLKD